MSLKRRTFSKEFKLHVVREVQLGRRQAEIARRYQILPKLISRWVAGYETHAEEAFAGRGPESLPKTLKYEEVYLSEYHSLEEALECIEYFLEGVYNCNRLHSGLGYRPPAEFGTITELALAVFPWLMVSLSGCAPALCDRRVR
jgi:transposase-like protein